MRALHEQLKIARKLDSNGGRRPAEGLYDPANEHDACGVGFVANIKGRKSHDLVMKGLEVLANLEHRGACGCDPDTGDGAGALIQMPDRFLREATQEIGIDLPKFGEYASGMIFLSQAPRDRDEQQVQFERTVSDEGQSFLGWRDVPISPESIGRVARESMPIIRQVFVGAAEQEGDS